MGKAKTVWAATVLRGVLSLGRRLRAERPRGSASLSAIAVMSTLNRLGPISATRLAAEERLQPQSLTRVIAGLEAEGWIERTRGGKDRREIHIALTPGGRRVLVEDMQGRLAWLEGAMASALTLAEQDVLLRSADVMIKLARHSGADGRDTLPTSRRPSSPG